MLNTSALVNDGLDTFGSHPHVCLNNRRPAYTYNQGVWLSAVGEFYASKLPPPAAHLHAHVLERQLGAAVDAAAAASPLYSAIIGESDQGRHPAERHADVRTHMSMAVGEANRDQASDRAALLRLACTAIEAVWRSHLVYNESGGVLREEGEAELINGA